MSSFFAGRLTAQSISVTSITTTPVCAGNTVTITFSTTNGNGSGNRYDNQTVYTIYLSNASGTGYTSQGTFSTTGVSYSSSNGGTTSGITRVFTIPSGTANGTGYKISLGSSSPTFNGSTGAGASAAFTVNALPPVANAGPNQTGSSTCGLTQVALAGNSPSPGTSLWTIVSGTGGSFGSAASATSTFSGAAGQSYTLRWTISNGACTSTSSTVNVTFNINSVAASSASANPTTVCPSGPATLSITGGSLGTGASWKWYSGSCGGTLVGTGASVQVNPASTTTYYVRAEGLCGNTACKSVTVTVNAGTAPTMPGGITGNIVTCNGATGVQYSVQPAPNAATYDWTLPAGAVIASGAGTRIITVNFPNPFTSGDICVTSVNACGATSASRCLTVTRVNNFVPARITGPSNVCLNATEIGYTAPNINGATNYNWMLPPGMTITSGAGTYSITVSTGSSITPGPMCVSVDNTCGTSQAKCINITVNSNATPGGITGPGGVCANTNGLTWSVQPVSGSTSYTWSVPSGYTITSGQGSNVITADVGSSPSTDDVCVTANFACGASMPRCLNVVNNGETPGPITGTANVCAGSTGIAYSVPAIVGATSYNWTFPAGVTQSSGGNTRNITVNIGAGFTSGDICVTATTVCGVSAAGCLTLQNINQSNPGGITGQAAVCPSTSNVVYSIQPVSGATSYIWTVPSGMTIVSGGSGQAVTVDIGPSFTSGSICVVAVSSCGIQSQSRCMTVTTISNSTPASITGPASICPNTMGVTFSTPAVSGVTSYNWSLPAGLVFSSGSPTATNMISVDITPGFTSGEVCVTLESGCGSSNTKCLTLTDMTSVVPGGITGPSLVCRNATALQYSIQPVSGAASYEWIVPPGITIASGETTRIITVDVDNTFSVGDIGVRAISPCASKSQIRWNTNTTSANPAQPGNISESAALCPGTTVALSVPVVSGAASYAWTLPSGLTLNAGSLSNSNSISVDVGSGFRQGDVCVRAISACNVSGYMKCETYNVVPATPGTISGPAGVCPSATGINYSVSVVSGAASYDWSLPSGWTITSGAGTNSITANASSSFIQGQVSVCAISACGNKSGRKILNVNYAPATPGSITGPVAVCDGKTESYSVPSVSGAASYTWSLPDGMVLSSGNPGNTNSISVDVNSAFTGGQICVTANTTCGGVSSQRCLTIGTIPSTPAINGPGLVCPGASSVNYSVQTLSGYISYTWTAPPGVTITSGQGTSSITVDVGGGFTSGDLCVMAVNFCGTPGPNRCLTLSKTAEAPQAVSTQANFCPGTIRKLTVTPVQGAVAYSWVLPTGLTAVYGQNSESITVQIASGFTSGLVCVSAISECGQTGAQLCQTVSLSPAGTPSSLTVPSVVCSGSSMEFSTSVVPGAGRFNWMVPSGIAILSGQGSPTITTSVSGGFSGGDVCVTALSGCSNAGSQVCTTVSVAPPTPGTITSPTVVCPNENNIHFSVAALAGVSSYNWSIPSGMTFTSGQGSNSILVSTDPAFTSGTVSVNALSSCGVAGGTKSITVGTALATPGTITTPASVCPNSNGLVFSVSQVTGATSYAWTLPASFTVVSGANSNVITVNVGAGFTTGQVCVAAVSSCGVSGPQRCSTINYLPSQPGGVTGTTKGVCGQTLQYSVQPASGAITYTWAAPAGATISSGQGTRIIQVTFSETFTSGQLTVFSSNGCGSSSVRTSSVITGTPDKPSVVSGPSSVCNNQQGVNFSIPSVFGATSYTWSLPSGATITSGQGTDNIMANWGTTAGNVSVMASNTCGTSAATLRPIIINCRMSAGSEGVAAITVFPNPATEDFVIKFESSANQVNYSFELYDMTGRVVTTKTELAMKGKNLVVIDVRNYPRGAYVLKIAGEDGNAVQARIILK